jgi:hypothetical protein
MPPLHCTFWKILVPALTVTGLGGSAAQITAQEVDWRKPGSSHVRELEQYFQHLEIYAGIAYRDLAIYPVRLRGGQHLRGDWLTMDEALARGVLTVSEKGRDGQVPVVVVHNRSRNDTIFIMSGELITGGKQTRTMRQDVVLAPGERAEVSVYCVEAHRWKGQADFHAGRALLPQSIQRELRSGADQRRIWSEVARNNAALNAENETGSLELALKSRSVKSQLDAVRSRILPEVPADSVGFLFLDRGRAVGADFFGRSDLARSLLSKVIDAYSVDVILKQSGRPTRTGRLHDDAAVAFFERVRRAGSQRSTTPASGAGIRTRNTGLVGDGVSLGGVLVHYGIQSQTRIIPRPRPVPEMPYPRR